MSTFYILVCENYPIDSVELIEGDKEVVLEIQKQKINEYNLYPLQTFFIGPFSDKEEAELICSKLTKEKRKRGYYLIISDDAYFIEHGSLREHYSNMHILDFNVNDFKFYGPFRSEYEASYHIKKIDSQERLAK